MDYNFKDIYISRNLKFSIGVEESIEKYYVSFLVPTSNRKSDYEIYYWLPVNYSKYVYSERGKIYSYVLECCKGLHKDMEINLS